MRTTATQIFLLCMGLMFTLNVQADEKVSIEYIRDMKATGIRGLDVDDIIKLAETGVSPQYVRVMKNVGMRNFDVDDVIKLAQAKVKASYAKAARVHRFRNFDSNDVLRLHGAGVTQEYLEQMQKAGVHHLRHFDEKDMIALHHAGVPAQYVKDTRNIGLRNFDTKDVVKLHTAGVPAQYIKDGHWSGLRHFDANDAIRLHKAGVPVEFIKEAKALGARDANEVIRLASKTGHASVVVQPERQHRTSTRSTLWEKASHGVTMLGVVMLVGFAVFTLKKKRYPYMTSVGDDMDVRLTRFESRVNDLQDVLLSIDDRLDRRLKRS